MPRIALICCTLIGLAAPAAHGDGPPGGLVYRDGVDVVYRAFADGARAELTAGVEERAFGPVGVSRDGRLAVWLGRAEFQGRMLPGGPPFTLPVGKSVFAAEGGGVASERILSLAVSPSRRLIAYELEREGRHIVSVALVLPYLHGDPRLACTEPILMEQEDLCEPAWAPGRDLLACASLRGVPRSPAVLYDFEGAWRAAYGAPEGGRSGQDFRAGQVELGHSTIDELAWRPDGTLTYLRRDVIYAADGTRLFEGRAHGVGLQWLDEQSFVFRGWDGALYGWAGGMGGQLLEGVPKQFAYCRESPIAPAGTQTIAMGQALAVGPFETEWCGAAAKGGAADEVLLLTAPPAHEEWQYALPGAGSIGQIADPSLHAFAKASAAPEGARDERGRPCVAVPVGGVVLLRRRGMYAALRPLKVQSVGAGAQGRLSFEWRLWPGGEQRAEGGAFSGR